MKRAAWLWALGIALVFACERPSATPTRPNVVLIVIDTLRPDRLPFYGHSEPTAPFLSSLAERSLVFTRAHSPSSWTAPSMASLFTSLHPFQHGVHLASLADDRQSFEVKVLPVGVPTLPEALGSVGYRTFGVSDNQNVSERPGFSRGFDRFASTNYESAASVNQTLSGWRQEILSSEPYFLYIHYMDPHMPYHAREPWYGEYAPAAGDADEHADALARYDSEIRYVDEHIEELFSSFGWGDETVVIVTSDHGEEFGEHGGEQHGRTLYGEVVDIPLLLHAPRFGSGLVDRRVSLVDVAPTLLALAGHSGQSAHVGRSLLTYVAGTSEDERSIYTQLIREDPSSKTRERVETRGIIRGRFKLLARGERDRELFDLEADAAERRSLSDRHPDVVDRLAADLDGAVAGAPRFEPGTARIPLSPKQIEKLKALGYAK